MSNQDTCYLAVLVLAMLLCFIIINSLIDTIPLELSMEEINQAISNHGAYAIYKVNIRRATVICTHCGERLIHTCQELQQ